ncbi:MAG: FliA/WhiG family RNA polymerase sigma factor [Planctomycetes bacterium]|nr:FliA/WhiG family RNA polymerase sigma factor [Planctomycetota bacterium]
MKAKGKKEIARLWVEYKRTSQKQYFDTIVLQYLPLVRYTAERIRGKLPRGVDVDDLFSAGIFGLMGAIKAFDIARGVKFETYCTPRVRGAILDHLRSEDWVPRLVRSRAHRLEQAYDALRVELGRNPTDGETAEYMEISMAEFHHIRKESNAVAMISLDRRWGSDDDDGIKELDIVSDQKGEDPIRNIQKKDLRDLITRGLNSKERLIIVLYYYEQLTMKEIGLTLGLSESRVSQMHAAILLRLRKLLADRKEEFVS